ncbi:hypothetical protein ACH5RR_007021 [Cinchona calisaya]|uniref:Uncharacterized protein n=1 Tax=Cinchona calisaya TaxID=153742 RepID=A0ABD3AQQ5_9GENT
MIMEDNDDYFSSSDESCILALNDDEDDGVSGETLSASDTDKSDIDFSDFEENVDSDIVFDSETDEAIDPMKAAMRSKMWTYNPRDDAEFEKGMPFTNVDAFRAALKGYVF